MKGDIALAGFMMTAEEWLALDAVSRAQLITAATRPDDPWVMTGATGLLSGPIAVPVTDDR